MRISGITVLIYLPFTIDDLLFFAIYDLLFRIYYSEPWKSVRNSLPLASLRKCCRLASQRCVVLRASAVFLRCVSRHILSVSTSTLFAKRWTFLVPGFAMANSPNQLTTRS